MMLTTITALFFTMVILAAVPSISVITVVTRSASKGFIHGAFTAAGIVCGDLIFIAIALFGLSLLAGILGELFVVIKILGGGWLVWLGISYWRSHAMSTPGESIGNASLRSSFLAGLLITLADQKAVLFYLGFFPAFIDLTALTGLDAVIIIGVTIIAVGGTKLVYALLAGKAGRLLADTNANRVMHAIAGSVMIAVGCFLFISVKSL